jgi:hypothetical protein
MGYVGVGLIDDHHRSYAAVGEENWWLTLSTELRVLEELGKLWELRKFGG